MNELTLLRELGDELDPPAPGPGPDVRRRVLTTICTGRARPAPARLSLLVPGLAAALSAGVAAALLLPGALAPQAGGPGPAATTRATASASASAAQELDARGLLLAAAQTARSESLSTPAPSAYVYRRTRILTFEGHQQTSESWDSVDGRHPSWGQGDGDPYMRENEGCPVSGVITWVWNGKRVTNHCIVDPAYRTDIPTQADAAYRYLLKLGAGHPDGAFEQGAQLVAGHIVAPAARAAVLEAMARIPGVVLRGDATTLSGRHAVALTLDGRYDRQLVLISKAEHRIVGGGTERPDGRLLGGWEALQLSVVGHPLVRPDGTRYDGPFKPKAKTTRKP